MKKNKQTNKMGPTLSRSYTIPAKKKKKTGENNIINMVVAPEISDILFITSLDHSVYG